MKRYCGAAAVVLMSMVGLFSAVSAHAAVTLAGSALLTASDQAQLASWLGEGPLELKNVYTKAQGDTSHNFHQAADGKGRTFSVMQASNEFGQTWLIGGYNPQSWSSAGTYNRTLEQAGRTAFLFNLTLGALHRQTPQGPALDTVGSYQTYNAANFGPTFGIGHDLYVPANLTTGGYSSLYSYIDPATGVFGKSVLDGTLYHGGNITFGVIEVFTISAIPEPESGLMLLAGLAVVSLMVRRHAAA